MKPVTDPYLLNAEKRLGVLRWTGYFMRTLEDGTKARYGIGYCDNEYGPHYLGIPEGRDDLAIWVSDSAKGLKKQIPNE